MQTRSTKLGIDMTDLKIRHGGPIKKEGCCICFCHYAQVHHQVLQGIGNTSHLGLMHSYQSTRHMQLVKYAVVHEGSASTCLDRYSAAIDPHLSVLSGSMQAFRWCASGCRSKNLMCHGSGQTRTRAHTHELQQLCSCTCSTATSK